LTFSGSPANVQGKNPRLMWNAELELLDDPVIFKANTHLSELVDI
jgi:hypothetical protein